MPCYQSVGFRCGKCPGCREALSSDWASRLFHESKCHEQNSFITLTFESDDVIEVDRETCVLFLKRLRKALEPKRIRFYLVAEYGDKNQRPHYHAIIFGHDFRLDDGAREVQRGLYSSPLLEAAWGHGYVSSGAVSDASIRYVSNYVLQKSAPVIYLNPETGEPRELLPVFAMMSRQPGIGAKWIDEHARETYRDDDIVVGNFRRQPPRYYDRRVFGDSSHVLAEKRRKKRLDKAQLDVTEYLRGIHPDRKVAAAKIHRAKRGMKKRGTL